MQGYGKGIQNAIRAIKKGQGDLDLKWINGLRIATKTKLGENMKILSRMSLDGNTVPDTKRVL
jgi:hypothetical protein